MYITWTYITLAIVRDVECDAAGREVDQHCQQQNLGVPRDIERKRDDPRLHVKAGCRHVEREPQVGADELPEEEDAQACSQVHLADVRRAPEHAASDQTEQDEIAEHVAGQQRAPARTRPAARPRRGRAERCRAARHPPPRTARTYSAGGATAPRHVSKCRRPARPPRTARSSARRGPRSARASAALGAAAADSAGAGFQNASSQHAGHGQQRSAGRRRAPPPRPSSAAPRAPPRRSPAWR